MKLYRKHSTAPLSTFYLISVIQFQQAFELSYFKMHFLKLKGDGFTVLQKLDIGSLVSSAAGDEFSNYFSLNLY